MPSLIDVAYALAKANPRRPSQPFLKRAVSTAYYALFQALARDCAEQLIGGGAARLRPEWSQVFRALEHGAAKNACLQVGNLGLSPDIVTFADAFLNLQYERQRADYDPFSGYNCEESLALVDEADRAIKSLMSASRLDRRAVAVLAVFRKR